MLRAKPTATRIIHKSQHDVFHETGKDLHIVHDQNCSWTGKHLHIVPEHLETIHKMRPFYETFYGQKIRI